MKFSSSLSNAPMVDDVAPEKIVFITGPVNSGKSTSAAGLINCLRQQGIDCGGFLTEALYENGKKTGYRAVGVRDSFSSLVVNENFRSESPPGYEKTGKFLFDISAGECLRKKIESELACDLIVIDEIGPLELQGKGHWKLLENLLNAYKGTLVIVVREEIADLLKMKTGKSEIAVLRPGKEHGSLPGWEKAV